jgi:hypothetical protein
MSKSYIADHVVLGLDIKAYSQRDLSRQKFAQEVLDRCLDKAFPTTTWDAGKAIWIDGGDGGFVLLQGSEQSVFNAVQDFYEALNWENKNTQPQDQIKVRAAIHIDQVVRWETRFGPKYTGHAINNCARLLSAMSKLLEGQVVCSGAFLEKVNALGTDVINERLKDITDKHGLTHLVYNIYRSPGFGEKALSEERHPDPLTW